MEPLACPSGEIVILRSLSSQESVLGEQPKPQESSGSASELEETLLLPTPKSLSTCLCAGAVEQSCPRDLISAQPRQ